MLTLPFWARLWRLRSPKYSLRVSLYLSISSHTSSKLLPSFFSQIARLMAVLDLPTPPFPLVTVMTLASGLACLFAFMIRSDDDRPRYRENEEPYDGDHRYRIPPRRMLFLLRSAFGADAVEGVSGEAGAALKIFALFQGLVFEVGDLLGKRLIRAGRKGEILPRADLFAFPAFYAVINRLRDRLAPRTAVVGEVGRGGSARVPVEA